MATDKRLGTDERAHPTQGVPREAVAFITTRLGIDGAAFNPAYLKRRIRARMLARGISDIGSYLSAARLDPEEQRQLKDAITINVTEFMRDPGTWRAIGRKVLSQLLPLKGRRFPLRCWSAGCASGEEAYSLAISIKERLEEIGQNVRASILASDIDVDSLAAARAGIYPAGRIKNIPQRLAQKYIEPIDAEAARSSIPDLDEPAFRVRQDVRDLVTVREYDLAGGKPPGLFDLVLCRNVVIYFTPDMHDRLLKTVHASLKSGGYLVMGRTELLRRRQRELFEIVDARERIYRKVKPPGAS